MRHCPSVCLSVCLSFRLSVFLHASVTPPTICVCACPSPTSTPTQRRNQSQTPITHPCRACAPGRIGARHDGHGLGLLFAQQLRGGACVHARGRWDVWTVCVQAAAHALLYTLRTSRRPLPTDRVYPSVQSIPHSPTTPPQAFLVAALCEEVIKYLAMLRLKKLSYVRACLCVCISTTKSSLVLIPYVLACVSMYALLLNPRSFSVLKNKNSLYVMIKSSLVVVLILLKKQKPNPRNNCYRCKTPRPWSPTV